MTTHHDKAKRWRPWQFSLRALLLLMLVVVSYLGGWMSNEWKQQRELERSEQEMQAEMQKNVEAMVQFLTEPSPVSPASDPELQSTR